MLLISWHARVGKLGPGVIATYRAKDTCPTDCFVYDDCYANGRIFSHAQRADTDEVDAMTALAVRAHRRAIIRHHVSGDLLLSTGDVDWRYIEAMVGLAERRPDLVHLIYTHAWREIGDNPFPFPANASCDRLGDIDKARALGWQTALVNAEDDLGPHVTTCLEQTHGIKCSSCLLCAKERRATVRFLPHGSAKNRLIKRLETQ